MRSILILSIGLILNGCAHKFIMKNCRPTLKKETIEYHKNGLVTGEPTGEENCQQRSVFDE